MGDSYFLRPHVLYKLKIFILCSSCMSCKDFLKLICWAVQVNGFVTENTVLQKTKSFKYYILKTQEKTKKINWSEDKIET